MLVVDDDRTVSDVVVKYLKHAGLRADRVEDGLEALMLFRGEAADDDPYDLVVLDLMLPTMSGLDVCRELRADDAAGGISARPPIPVVMLTARGNEEDRVLGLEVGADDYVTKPFSPRELVLRIQSVLRRTRAASMQEPQDVAAVAVLRDGDVDVDVAAHRAHLAGRELSLTSREFDLLAFFLANPGQAFSREELMRQVWQWEYGDQSTVTVHVRRLREKLEVEPADPQRLVTVWGVGYRWDLSSRRAPEAVAARASAAPIDQPTVPATEASS